MRRDAHGRDNVVGERYGHSDGGGKAAVLALGGGAAIGIVRASVRRRRALCGVWYGPPCPVRGRRAGDCRA